jgi:hypothetical protein
MKRKRPLTYNKRREHGQQLTNINTYRHYIDIYSMTGPLRGGGGGGGVSRGGDPRPLSLGGPQAN